MIFSIFCLIIAIAPTFAMDNDTAIGVHNEDIVGADIYFDAENIYSSRVSKLLFVKNGKNQENCFSNYRKQRYLQRYG